MVFPPHEFEALSRKLYHALSPSLQHVERDIQAKFKEILEAAFIHLDLVTREEFEVQTKVLARTREKVEALQTVLKALTDKP